MLVIENCVIPYIKLIFTFKITSKKAFQGTDKFLLT